MKYLFILSFAALMMTGCCNKCEQKTCGKECTECANAKVDLNQYSGGIQHVGIPTKDIPGSIAFYEGLGFSLASRKDIGGRDFAFMKLGNLIVELIPNDNPNPAPGAIDHICLDVKNIQCLFSKIKAQGYHMLNDELVDFDAWDNGTKLFFIQGPNGEKIEFCEIF